MGSPGVVVSLDVFKDRKAQLVECMICPAVRFFPFQVLEKTFTDGIVEGVSFFGKGLYHIQGI